MFGISWQSPSIKNWKIINFTKNVVKQCQIIAITKSLLVNSKLMEETFGTLSVPWTPLTSLTALLSLTLHLINRTVTLESNSNRTRILFYFYFFPANLAVFAYNIRIWLNNMDIATMRVNCDEWSRVGASHVFEVVGISLWVVSFHSPFIFILLHICYNRCEGEFLLTLTVLGFCNWEACHPFIKSMPSLLLFLL